MTVHLNHFEPNTEVLPRSSTSPETTSASPGFYRMRMKRGLDVLLILIALPIILPLVAILAFMVWLEGGKPFYSQRRIGLDGREFWIWKLRSMVPNAEALLEAHLAANPEARAEWNTSQKLSNDPRITRLGRFLRRTSFDELPQLWNVLRGDMSLVGPRPMMPCQQALYPGHAYYRLRPGVTGFWQISQRNRSSFASRAKFDAVYERQMSLGTDLKVLMSTVRVVLACTGR
jgi:exopolysaccharide production protein ExoY